MCVQFFVGPTLAYNGLDEYQYVHYKMKVSEDVYFGYAIPALLSFILALHLYAGKLKGEIVDQEKTTLFVRKNPLLPYYFIGIGFVSSILASFFSSDFGLVFYLLSSFKFVGLFLLVIGGSELKLLPMVLVVSSIVGSSLGGGMFHDLLTWLIFIGAVFGIKYKFGFNTKLIGCTIFILMATIIQVLKSGYRGAIGNATEDAGIETFATVYEEQNESQSIFSFERLAPATVRINQGFIITNIMNNVPAKEPFSRGEEMYQVFEAAVMPRILAPDKLRAGDRTVFMKYSGLRIRPGTSMGLSSVGDAYLNYGIVGGCIFMFLLGLLYSGILNVFHKQSFKYPALILFLPMIFYYPIRPDCELQTILGHLFKAIFLISCIVIFFKRNFLVESEPIK